MTSSLDLWVRERVMYLVVVRRTGPDWDPSGPIEAESEEQVRATLARDPWHESHLQIDSTDLWTIRLDGRRRP